MANENEKKPQRVRVTSDGEAHNTHVFVDGVEIQARAVELRACVGEPVIVKVELWVDEVEVDGRMAVERVAVPRNLDPITEAPVRVLEPDLYPRGKR